MWTNLTTAVQWAVVFAVKWLVVGLIWAMGVVWLLTTYGIVQRAELVALRQKASNGQEAFTIIQRTVELQKQQQASEPKP